jgi:hypothetical protein
MKECGCEMKDSGCEMKDHGSELKDFKCLEVGFPTERPDVHERYPKQAYAYHPSGPESTPSGPESPPSGPESNPSGDKSTPLVPQVGLRNGCGTWGSLYLGESGTRSSNFMDPVGDFSSCTTKESCIIQPSKSSRQDP